MHAFLQEKSLYCTMCGTAEWEWDERQGGSKFAYEAVTVRCQGCYVKESSADAQDRQPGHTVQLAPTVGIEAARRHVAAARAWRRGESE